MNGKVILLLGFVVIFALPFNSVYGESVYNDINWFDLIGYMVSNPWLAIQLSLDQGNVDSVYSHFSIMRNAYLDNNSYVVLDEYVNQVNGLVATNEYCENGLTKSNINSIVKAFEPYEKLDEYCNIPNQLDSFIRGKMS